MGFRVIGLGVKGLGFRVQGFWFKIYRVMGLYELRSKVRLGGSYRGM